MKNNQLYDKLVFEEAAKIKCKFINGKLITKIKVKNFFE